MQRQVSAAAAGPCAGVSAVRATGVGQRGRQRARERGRRLARDIGGVARHRRGASATTTGTSSSFATSARTAAAGSGGWNGASAAANALSEGIVKPALCNAARSTIDTRPRGIPDAVSTRPSRFPSSAATSGRGGSSPGDSVTVSVGMQPDVAGVQPCPDGPARLRRLRELDDERDRIPRGRRQSACSAGRRARREQEQPRRAVIATSIPGCDARAVNGSVDGRRVSSFRLSVRQAPSQLARGPAGRGRIASAHASSRFDVLARLARPADRARPRPVRPASRCSIGSRGRCARPSACRARSCTKPGRWRGACGGCAAAAASSTSAAGTGCSRTSCCCSTTPRRARSSSTRRCRPHTSGCTRRSSPSGRGSPAA